MKTRPKAAPVRGEPMIYSPAEGSELAVDPRALGAFFYTGETEADCGIEPDRDGIAVVRINGPLEHHSCWWWDSYDAIVQRIEATLANPEALSLVLRIDSPGGLCSGNIEAVRKIRRLAQESGKPIYAFADEMACSAAYALACAAKEIWLPDTATVGSVGVICALYDVTKANRKMGVDVRLVTSGARKADSQMARPLTDEIVKVAQERVDHLAEIFFEAVAEARGVGVPKIAGLQAGIYQGQKAVDVGLADSVAGWDAFLGHVREQMAIKSKGKGKAKATSKTTARTGTGADPKSEEALALEAVAAAEKRLSEVRSKIKSAPASEEEEEEEDDDEESEEDESEDDESEEDNDDESEDEDDDEESEEDEDSKSASAKSFGLSPSEAKDIFAVCQRITGQKSKAGVRGALEALGKSRAMFEKQAMSIAKLERESKRAKVDKMLVGARREGKITPAEIASLREAGMSNPKWLKGHLAVLPKLVRTSEDGAVKPGADSTGRTVGAPTTDDQKKMMAAATAGMPPEARKKFEEEMNGKATANHAGRF